MHLLTIHQPNNKAHCYFGQMGCLNL